MYCTEACALRSPRLISHVLFVTWGHGSVLVFPPFLLTRGEIIDGARVHRVFLFSTEQFSAPAQMTVSRSRCHHPQDPVQIQQEHVRYLENSTQTCSQVRFIIRRECKERVGCERSPCRHIIRHRASAGEHKKEAEPFEIMTKSI